MNDFRYALRTLGRSPGFTLIAIVTLALGIGANTAIFSAVNGVLLRPLPFGEPERLVRVFTSTADEARSAHSAGDFRDLQRQNQSLIALAGYRTLIVTVAPRPGEPTQLDAAFVTVDYFDVLAVQAGAGRTFTRQADASSAERLVVLSHGAARDLYGTGAAALGQQPRVDGDPHTVVGVLPPRAEWPERVRVWLLSPREVPPSPMDRDSPEDDREIRYFDAIGRIRPGISLVQAEQDLRRVAALLQQQRPTDSGRDIRIVPLREEIVGDVRPALLMMQAAVGLVLLIACANVASLVMTRAAGRQRELAIRAAVGARRGQLVRQLLAESLLLGVGGGLAGLLLGAWLARVLVRLLPAGVPRVNEIGFDAVVASVTLGTGLLTAILFGIAPAFGAAWADAAHALKRGGERGSARPRARGVLIVAQVALTVVLLAGAGLLLNSLVRLLQTDSGLRPDHVTLVSLMLPQSRYPTGAAQSELYRRILEALTNRPEVRAAGAGFPGPLRGSSATGSFLIEGRPDVPEQRPFANLGAVSGGYFAAMGIPLVAGRTFADSDEADAPEVAIANAALARKYWPGEDAVGKQLRFGDGPGPPWRTIVGVVGDVRQLGLGEAAPPILYIPYRQFPLPFTEIVIRSEAPTSAVASLVQTRLREIDPELPTGEFFTLTDVLGRSVAEPRFRAVLMSVFAALALVLSAVGLFGLVSYSVTQRTREVGIRMVLGANPHRVLLEMMREGIALTLVGIGLGLAGAVASARVIGAFLTGVAPTDQMTLTVVVLVLLAVAGIATYLPSRRALRVEPTAALRAD